MESTKEVLVRRSNNLFLPFSSDTRYAIGKDIAFSSDPTLFATIMNDGNIHIHGTKSAGDSGYVLLWSLTQRIVLKAGSTYNFSISATAHTQFILQSDQSGTRTNIMQVNPAFTNGLTKTMTEDIVITHVFMNISGATPINTGDTVDEYVNPMLVEQSARMDYEPYYHEYESTKEVVVRRSNNLFLPFSSNIDTVVEENKKFSSDNTLFGTVETDGNIHIHGTKSVADSGWYLISNFTSPLVLKAGKTYSFKCNQPYGNCVLQSTVSGSRQTVMNKEIQSVTPTVDTPITHIYMDMFSTTKDETNIGKEYDFYINPMVVEGDTAQDYEPYYYEAEASKLITWAVDDTLVSVMDFSNMLYNKFIDNNGNITSNGMWATTANFSPCTGNTVYWYNANMINYYPFYRGCRFVFYDENKQFIGTAGASSDKEDKSVTSPANARYMKASISRFGNNDLSQPFPIKPIVYIK